MKRARRGSSAAVDVPPLDRLEGWPGPEERTDWLGESAAEEKLLDAYRSGRMHHAWLMCGPKGIGKATLAYRFARFVLANPDPGAPEVAAATDLSLDPQHPVLRKVAARAHPNLLVLQRGYNDERKRYFTELTVDQIRRTISFFGSTSGEPGWRIAIVDPADDMNANAANALLKILEEPPARALFLVVSHAPGRLVATIRSRCRRIDLHPLEPEIIAEAIRQGPRGTASVDESDLRLATFLAEGSLRRAVHLVEGGGIEIYRDLARLLEAIPDLDVKAMHAFADRVSGRGGDDSFDTFLEALHAWLDRRVRRVEEPDETLTLSAATKAAPLERWTQVWENVRRSSTLADALNLDRKQAVLSILMNLAGAVKV